MADAIAVVWTKPSRLAAVMAAMLALALVAGCSREEEPTDEMDSAPSAALQAAVADSGRSEQNRMRDSYRHPVETLAFFEVMPEMTVVEIWPGGGWYTEILASYLAEQGNLYLADYSLVGARNFMIRGRQATEDKYGAADYIGITSFGKNDAVLAPPGSVDVVLTFRNLHNWLAAGYMHKAFEAAWVALKPGGVLGVVEHRAAPDTSEEQMKSSGYISEALAIEMAEAAGFVLQARSEVNANPQDVKEYPGGVWTLPPTLRLEGKDREKYLAIGESDRMTLKFVKPAH